MTIQFTKRTLLYMNEIWGYKTQATYGYLNRTSLKKIEYEI